MVVVDDSGLFALRSIAIVPSSYAQFEYKYRFDEARIQLLFLLITP